MKLMDIINTSELEPKNWTVEELFHIVLYELGFSFTLLGTQYLEEFFYLAYTKYDNASKIIISDLYDELSLTHNVSADSISRAIRYSIMVAWDKGNTQLQNAIWGYTTDPERGKPTLMEFLCLMVELFKL